jgi:hypothetical protein
MARTAAQKTLEGRWPAERFELELESEQDERWNHLFDRSHYGASFRVFEYADTASVTLGPNGPPALAVRYPSEPGVEPDSSPDATASPPAAALIDARRAAEDAARRAGRWQTLRSRVLAWRGPGSEGAYEVQVRLFSHAPEGPMTIDIDSATGERLAFFVPCWLRGSRQGRPLSKRQVAARVQEDPVLPEGVRLARADLEEPTGARLWRLKYEPSSIDRFGQAILCAHARTGVVIGLTSTIRTRVRIGRGRSPEKARALVERALPILLGPDATVASLVPGALVRRGTPRAGWVGTALTGDGGVVRVALAGEEVEVACGGKFVRARVGAHGVVLVNEGRRERPHPVEAGHRPVPASVGD